MEIRNNTAHRIGFGILSVRRTMPEKHEVTPINDVPIIKELGIEIKNPGGVTLLENAGIKSRTDIFEINPPEREPEVAKTLKRSGYAVEHIPTKTSKEAALTFFKLYNQIIDRGIKIHPDSKKDFMGVRIPIPTKKPSLKLLK